MGDFSTVHCKQVFHFKSVHFNEVSPLYSHLPSHCATPTCAQDSKITESNTTLLLAIRSLAIANSTQGLNDLCTLLL